MFFSGDKRKTEVLVQVPAECVCIQPRQIALIAKCFHNLKVAGSTPEWEPSLSN